MGAVRTITRDGLAKEWGISVNVIDNMLQRKQLRKRGHGLIDYDHAVTVRAGQSPAARERAIVAKAAKAEAEAVAAPPAKGEAPPGPPDTPVLGGTAEAMLKARAAKTIADAKIATLQHRKLEGSLVEREAIKREAANAGRVLVARLGALAPRLGPMLASVSDPAECIKLIEREVAQLATELREALAAL